MWSGNAPRQASSGSASAIGMHEDQPTPTADRRRSEAPVGPIEVRELLGLGHLAQLAVEAEVPEVVRADEARVAADRSRRPPAWPDGVHMLWNARSSPSRSRSDHQRHATGRVRHERAWLGQIFLAAHQVPRVAEELVLLTVEPLGRPVGLGRHEESGFHRPSKVGRIGDGEQDRSRYRRRNPD